ncbi:hypothetical protein [Polaromonas sp.]|uniref:hypothetical protein n=1 Tax=Polaromonas sp. TaxID=1869339 RepID=UPI00326446C5
MTGRLFSLVALTAAMAVSPAHAETVKVGRASIELPEGNWKALATSNGQDKASDGSADGALPTETRSFAFISDGRVMAILYVNSSKAGGLEVNWINTCTSTQSVLALNLTKNPNALECVRMSVPLKAEQYLKLAMPDVLNAMEARHMAVPPAMQAIGVTVGSFGGTSMHVNLLAVPSFLGLQGEEVSTLPAPLKPGQLVWARQLAAAVKGSLYSMSGNMTLPPLAFAPRVNSSTSQ